MSMEIKYCPNCASEVDVLGVDIEDRRVAECPECEYIEVVYHAIGGELPESLRHLL